jgi:ABC-type polysaccharide/polyol phosphate export permease
VPFLVQAWFFATPAVFVQLGQPPPASVFGSESLFVNLRSLLYHLNPMNGLIDFFRTAVVGGALPWDEFAVAAVVAAVALVVGCLSFRRAEDSFVDVI